MLPRVDGGGIGGSEGSEGGEEVEGKEAISWAEDALVDVLVNESYAWIESKRLGPGCSGKRKVKVVMISKKEKPFFDFICFSLDVAIPSPARRPQPWVCLDLGQSPDRL